MEAATLRRETDRAHRLAGNADSFKTVFFPQSRDRREKRLRVGMPGYTHMHDPPRAMLQKDEYIENPKRHRYRYKEITGQDESSIILQESGPALVIS